MGVFVCRPGFVAQGLVRALKFRLCGPVGLSLLGSRVVGCHMAVVVRCVFIVLWSRSRL